MNKRLHYLIMCLFAFCFANAQFTSMAIVGDGAGIWPANTPGEVDAHQMTSTDGIHWTIDNLVTFQGSVKFRAENSWTNNWGGATFPDGVGLFDSQTNNIPTIPGVYDVSFNSTTLAYSFVSQNIYPVVSLTGPGVVGSDWDLDTDLLTTDGVTYSRSGVALDGELKFRQDHAWTINWGAASFPEGTGVQDGDGIFVAPAGSYNVTFNRTTGAYRFYFSTIALVGDATPGDWPANTPGEIDPLQLTTEDGVSYNISAVTLVDGVAKLRANNAWVQEWSATEFPAGTGTQSGTGIPVSAGTYNITFNATTGAYNFETTVASTTDFSEFKVSVYPNPTQSVWNFVSENTISSIEITDISGKTVLFVKPENMQASIDVSNLSSGLYFAKINKEKLSSTIKLLKN